MTERRVFIVFRFDDYSARSATDMEIRIIDAFRKNGDPITFGVIPYISEGDVHDPSPSRVVPLGPTKGDILRSASEAGILEIALHGYSHQTVDAEHLTEFSGLDYPSQLERIASGKELLERLVGAPVTTFIPPWNEYDLNTLRVLEDLKFTTISASISGEATEDSPLMFLPATCDLLQLRRAVKAARRSSDTQPVIVVLFHVYDFMEIDRERGNITYQEFSDLLNWLKSQGDVRLLSIIEAATVINDLSVHRFLLNKRIDSVLRLLPSSLRQKHDNQYSESPHVLFRTSLRVGFFYLAIVALVLFTSFILGYLVFPKSTLITDISIYGSLVVLVIILIYAFHDLQIHYLGMMVIAGLVGACIGIWLSFLSLKKKSFLGKSNRR